MIENGWTIGKGEEGPSWEREREGRRESSIIDFFISHGQDKWHRAKKEKLLSDHWAIESSIDWRGQRPNIKKQVIDW